MRVTRKSASFGAVWSRTQSANCLSSLTTTREGPFSTAPPPPHPARTTRANNEVRTCMRPSCQHARRALPKRTGDFRVIGRSPQQLTFPAEQFVLVFITEYKSTAATTTTPTARPQVIGVSGIGSLEAG